MHEEKRHYPQAVKHYKTLVERFGDNEYAERASWQLGWLYHRTGDFQKAFEHFMENARRYPGGLFIESSMFWAAKSAESLGRVNLAQQLYKDSSNRSLTPTTASATGEKKNRQEIRCRRQTDARRYHSTNLPSQPTHGFIIRGELNCRRLDSMKTRVMKLKNWKTLFAKTFPGVMWLATLFNNAHAYPDTVRIMQLYKNLQNKN